MKDIMNHFTNVNGILWYMDSLEVNGSALTFKGWLAHTEQAISSITLNNQPVLTTIGFRPDVVKVYPFLKTPHVGVEVTINRNQIKDSVGLILADGSTVQNIGTFEKWAIFYSGFNPIQKKGVVVVDNFYDNPDWIRSFAMNNLTFAGSDYHRGKRSEERFILNGTKEAFERILGKEIINWNDPSYANGKFQYCTSTDPIVYHVDTQTYAAMVYLTPDAPLNSGTATYRSKITGATRFDNYDDNPELYERTFKGRSSQMNFYDNSTYELVDSIANVYNRLVMFDAKTLHAATNYFGDSIETARFFQLFFFDVAW